MTGNLRKPAKIAGAATALLLGLVILLPIHAQNADQATEQAQEGTISSLFGAVEPPQMQNAYYKNVLQIQGSTTLIQLSRMIAQLLNTIMFRVYDIEQQLFGSLQMFATWFLPDTMENTAELLAEPKPYYLVIKKDDLAVIKHDLGAYQEVMQTTGVYFINNPLKMMISSLSKSGIESKLSYYSVIRKG